MKGYITIEECNKKIVAYAIIIAIASIILIINIVAMTCHANSVKENSNQTIQPYGR